MKAKSHKQFKEGIAEEVKVHPSVVDELISFYYARIRSSLSSIEDYRVYVEGLGTFGLRRSKVEKAIIKNKSYLGNLEKHTYNGYDKTVSIKSKINKLESALVKLDSAIDSRKEFKKNKNGIS